MYPTIIQLGPLHISSIGFFMTFAFLAASFLTWREAKREYLDEEAVLDVFLLSVAFGIVGARISFIFLYPDRFGINILRWLLPSWMPGFYLYGGIIVGIAAAFLISERRKLGFSKFLDAIIPGVIFAAALYKIGKWLDGSVIGVATESFIGLPVVGESGRFVPVALIEAIMFFAIFIVLVRVRNYFIVKRKIVGAQFLAGVSLAALVENGVFFLTRDKIYLVSVPISLSISVLAFIVSVILLYRKTRILREDLQILHAHINSLFKTVRKKIK